MLILRRIVLLLLIYSSASATDTFIGIFGDEQGNNCDGDILPYEPIELNILLYNSSYDFPHTEVEGLELSVGNLPVQDDYPYGRYEFEWYSEMVTGDPKSGVHLQFDPPLDVSETFTPIGQISFLEFDDAWIPEYFVICIQGSDLGNGLILYPPKAEPFYMYYGGAFCLNLEPGYWFDCFGYDCYASSEIETWSSIKALYP